MPLLTFSRRWCQSHPVRTFNPGRAKSELLGLDGFESDMQLMLAPAAPNDEVRFKVYRNQQQLMVACVAFNGRPGAPGVPAEDALELHFNPSRDRIGRVQFVFSADGSASRHTFLPYPDFYGSNYQIPQLLRHETSEQRLGNQRLRWVMAWFDLKQIIPDGVACGFNVCRSRSDLPEHSAWQYPAGNGFQDPADYGELWVDLPAGVPEQIHFDRDQTAVVFRASGPSAALRDGTTELIDPLGVSHGLRWKLQGKAATARVTLKRQLPGRYRLRVTPSQGTAPVQWHFDEAPSAADASFTVAFTADAPMNMRDNYYTPDRLSEEMATWSRWGVNRIYWIDKGYGSVPPSNTPLVKKSYRACGDVLGAMVHASRAHNVEPWAIFKTFDLAIGRPFTAGDSAQAGQRKTVPDLENRPVTAIRELVENQHATMHADEAWPTEPAEPVTTLRLYSLAPIDEISAKNVRLLVSDDNQTYRRYRGPWRFTQGKVQRPHYQWTPAGKQRQPGQQTNHYIELAGLKLTAPYVIVAVDGCEAKLSHRLFMLAEALDAQGREQPLTLADEGDAQSGLVFWKKWRTWVNRDEAPLEAVDWPLSEVGMALRIMPNATALLEPTCDDTHRIWLECIGRQLDAGVAGVDIRTLCHHNTVPSYLRYAFAPSVLERFVSRFGRRPEMTAEDYQRIREIRGQAYTDFIRQASELVRGRGAKLAIHLESGMEIPPHLDTRMQIQWDWRLWIEQGLVDGVTLKWFSAHSSFVHEHVLPLCRQRDIPVHICSRNMDRGPDLRGAELMPQLVREARAAGFAGYNFYETANFGMIGPEGHYVPRGNTARVVSVATAYGADRRG